MGFSRREGERFNRGRVSTLVIAGGSAPVTPVTILGSKAVAWWRSDLGITLGTGVSAHTDQIGAVNLAQGTAGSQPAYNAADAAFNGRPSIQGDGVDDLLTSALARVAPGTVNTVIWAIVYQGSWTITEMLFADATSARFQVRQDGVSPEMKMFNGTLGPANNGMPLATAKRLEAGSTGSAADYLKIGAVSVTGTNTGNNAGTGFRVFASSVPSLWSATRYAEIVITNGLLTGPEQAALDSYASGLYGAGVLT